MTRKRRVAWVSTPDGEKLSIVSPVAARLALQTEGDPGDPLNFHLLGLPDDMAVALSVLRRATVAAADTAEVRNAVSVLERYASAHIGRAKGTRRGADATRMDDATFLEAHRIATNLAAADPRLKLSEIRRLVAARIGCSDKTLERYGVRPIEKNDRGQR